MNGFEGASNGTGKNLWYRVGIPGYLTTCNPGGGYVDGDERFVGCIPSLELCRLLASQPLRKVGIQEFPDTDSNDSMGGRMRTGPKDRD